MALALWRYGTGQQAMSSGMLLVCRECAWMHARIHAPGNFLAMVLGKITTTPQRRGI
jgi:hypothetical protein